MSDEFVHLHVHSEYSMLDGAARIKDMVEAVANDKQKALGISDHGNMYGVIEHYKTCKENNIKPILGEELYMSKESRFERPQKKTGTLDDGGGEQISGEKLYYHLTALAETNEGYQNLMKLSSEAYLSGYYYKPRADWELLERFHEGIIVTTGCLGGLVLQALMRNEYEEALKTAARLQDIFGKDNLFVELQDHGIPEQIQTNPLLVKIAKELNAPLLAVNDSHYVNRSDHNFHDALLCIQTNSLMSNPDRFKFSGEEHYLKTAEEMGFLFRDYPNACSNTLWIAERANVEIEFGIPKLPDFPLPAWYDDHDEYLKDMALRGAKEKYGEQLPQEVIERLDYELSVIQRMGFSTYFLIVWDLMKFAKESGIRTGPGRGSGAGSCVAYSLDIVKLDPLKYGLLFERFLNPDRVAMPDLDLDFEVSKREHVINYVQEKYGSDHVAQIISYSTIKARSAVKDTARVLGYEYSFGDKLVKAMPPVSMGRDTPLKACLEKDPKHLDGYKKAAEFRRLYDSDADAKKIIDIAIGLEGLKRQHSQHASATVISKAPLVEYLPIQRTPVKGSKEIGPLVTQYDMHGVEDLGLLKMDFLGLKNLDIIEMTLNLIKENRGIEVDIDHVPLDDDETYSSLRRGQGIGTFQLEGAAMRTLMMSLAPTSIEDLAALVALYRPGPMADNMHNDYADRKNGRKEISAIHPDLKELLSDSQSLMIYQESMMRVAQKFAGYTLAESDLLRKATGKKLREIMVKEREKFIQGSVKTGYGKELGKKLFDIIEPFADYSFNRSHALCYGYIAYQTAWLKVHYPAEYFAALLESVVDDKDSTAFYLAEARARGVKVLAPDINTSQAKYSVKDNQVLYGLIGIRNLGAKAVDKIMAERKKNGPFEDFYDFCNRVPLTVMNKKVIASLIRAGAFDGLGHKRKGLDDAYPEIVLSVSKRRKKEDVGQFDLFSSAGDDIFEERRVIITDREWDKLEKLNMEREMLGLFVSDHPLLGYEEVLRRNTDISIAAVKELDHEKFCKIGGVITTLTKKTTRRGDLMAVFTLQDLDSSMEVLVFPKSMKEIGNHLEEGKIVFIEGRLDIQEDASKFVCLDIFAPKVEQRFDLSFSESLNQDQLKKLKEILLKNHGTKTVYLALPEKSYKLPSEYNVKDGPDLHQDLNVNFGGLFTTARPV